MLGFSRYRKMHSERKIRSAEYALCKDALFKDALCGVMSIWRDGIPGAQRGVARCAAFYGRVA